MKRTGRIAVTAIAASTVVAGAGAVLAAVQAPATPVPVADQSSLDPAAAHQQFETALDDLSRQIAAAERRKDDIASPPAAPPAPPAHTTTGASGSGEHEEGGDDD